MTPSKIHKARKSSNRILHNRENILSLFSCPIFSSGVLWRTLNKQMCSGGAGCPCWCCLISPSLASDCTTHPQTGTLRDEHLGGLSAHVFSGHTLAWGAVIPRRGEKATGRKMRLMTFRRINNCDTTLPEGLRIHIPGRIARDGNLSIYPTLRKSACGLHDDINSIDQTVNTTEKSTGFILHCFLGKVLLQIIAYGKKWKKKGKWIYIFDVVSDLWTPLHKS